MAGQGNSGQGRARQGRTGLGRAGLGRGRAGQGSLTRKHNTRLERHTKDKPFSLFGRFQGYQINGADRLEDMESDQWLLLDQMS